MRSTARAFDDAEIDANPFFCPDAAAAARWEALVDEARKAGTSLGAVVECVATGVPAGWGAPLYAKLDAELAAAMMSINAVKGVEIGDGFAAARLRGEENADAMRAGPDGRPHFLANHAGGIARRHLDRPAGRACASRSSRPRSILTPQPRRSTATATRPKSPPRAATIPASASAARRWSRR